MDWSRVPHIRQAPMWAKVAYFVIVVGSLVASLVTTVIAFRQGDTVGTVWLFIGDPILIGGGQFLALLAVAKLTEEQAAQS